MPENLHNRGQNFCGLVERPDLFLETLEQNLRNVDQNLTKRGNFRHMGAICIPAVEFLDPKLQGFEQKMQKRRKIDK